MTASAGPFRVAVGRAGCGLTLDVGHFVGALVRELADQAREDPDGVVADLVAIADADSHARAVRSRGVEGYAEHERDHLVAQLVDRIGGPELPLATAEAHQLADQLREQAGRRLEPVEPKTERTAA